MDRIGKVSVFALGALLILSAHAAAQTLPTGIAGVVRDSSGAVIPGVTIEAASDALIEKVRTVVSDEQGQYKIVDLRPGTYTVTFTLAGFSTVRREKIELPAAFTAKVDAEMRVGALEETLTVSGVTPVSRVGRDALRAAAHEGNGRPCEGDGGRDDSAHRAGCRRQH